MLAGLDGKARLEHAGISAGVVPEIELVENPSGGHGLPSLLVRPSIVARARAGFDCAVQGRRGSRPGQVGAADISTPPERVGAIRSLYCSRIEIRPSRSAATRA